MFVQIIRINTKRTQFMTIEERKEKAKVLRYGDLTLLSAKSGYSVSQVKRYINGDFVKSGVEPYFLALVEKRQEEIANISFE